MAFIIKVLLNVQNAQLIVIVALLSSPFSSKKGINSEGQEVEFEKGQGRDGRPAAVKVRV